MPPGSSLMGIALEFIQEMTGYRTFDLLDMLANAAGVLGASWRRTDAAFS